MGYDIAQLIDTNEVDEDLICKVCYGLLEKPRMMCAEGHAFCQSCWCQWLARKRTCPTCRGIIDEATPLIKNRIAERMVGDLASWCPFRTARPSSSSRPQKRQRVDRAGCQWQGKLRDLEEHMETCEFALKSCKVSPLCTTSLPRGMIAEHERTCPHLRTLCVRCGRLVRVAALHHHQKSSKCHRAQSLLAEYLALVKHTAHCVAPDPPPRLARLIEAGSPLTPVDAAEATTHALVAVASGAPRACDRADCLKMATLLKHYAKCSSREEGTCPSGICDHLTLLLQLHARDCTAAPFCPIPFCMQWRMTEGIS
ncbi:hypothetical protein CTAYLR_003902 [Chrysophaeum taylorii]|uniref:RING-type domain-containing protein n=1 Tax=Chrysophaeum taylorii TaxID=2483200 RepID=A0AAD7XIJ8_9STRA|nr:hypothetical protein CTAYLR_003902 [Chrysophaeum taylorii]